MKKSIFLILAIASCLTASAQFTIPFDDILQFNNGCQLTEIAAPSTPSSGYGHLYVMTDGHVYFKNDAGEEYDLTAGTTGTVPSSRTLSINGSSYDLTANRSWTVGDLIAANNLSDLVSASSARTNLGLGTAATQNTSAFLQPSNNLSDVTTPATARTNLGLGGVALLSSISESNLAFTDITTANVSTSAHGLTPKLPNDATKFLDGTGNYTVPASRLGASTGGNAITAGTTQYAPIEGQNNFSSTEAQRQFIMPHAGTIKNLYVATGTSQPGTGSMVITMRKGGSNQTVTCTIAAGTGAGTFSDTTHSFTFAAGDLISIGFQNNASGSSANVISWSVQVTQ